MKLTKKQHTELTENKVKPWFCTSCSTLEKDTHKYDPFSDVEKLFSTENLLSVQTAKYNGNVAEKNSQIVLDQTDSCP